jgi:SAM-dependent methyltransferase
MSRLNELLERWRTDLAAWAIPDHVLAAATESPWALPERAMARRADHQMAEPGGPSFDRAWAALDPPGSVLDVGAGAGAASLPLVPRATALTAVDENPSLLAALATRATGVPTTTVVGRWPDIAGEVPAADVVTCHHVLYNVPDVGGFVWELDAHARRRVVVEVPVNHPLSPLNSLWLRFHDLHRPERPTVEDLLAIMDTMGLSVRYERWQRAAFLGYQGDEAVDFVRRQLCLPPERTAEVAQALAATPPVPRELVTIWWGPA